MLACFRAEAMGQGGELHLAVAVGSFIQQALMAGQLFHVWGLSSSSSSSTGSRVGCMGSRLVECWEVQQQQQAACCHLAVQQSRRRLHSMGDSCSSSTRWGHITIQWR